MSASDSPPTGPTSSNLAPGPADRPEAEYRTLVENAPVAVYRCEARPPWRVVQISAGVHHVTGRPPSEFLAGGLRWAHVVVPEDAPRVEQAVARGVADHARYEIEYRILDANSGVRWVHEVGQGQRHGASGESAYLEGVIFDITERKRAEEDLGRRLAYERLLTSVSFIAVQTDHPRRTQEACVAAIGEAIDVSRVYIFEYRPETDLLDNTAEWCAAGIEPQIDQLQGIPAGDFPWTMETLRGGQVLRFADIDEIPDAATRDVLRVQDVLAVLIVPLFAGGRLYGFLGFDECTRHREWRDEEVDFLLSISRVISLALERGRSVEQLQLSASVFTYAREGIIITDRDARIVDVNDAFTVITGYRREEAIGRNPRILQSGRQRPDFYVDMWRELTEIGYWHGEVWNRTKEGKEYVQSATISAVTDGEGRTTHYVALFTDVTAQKEHQRQLEHIAHYDAVTGLPNRVLLGDRLRQAMVQADRRGQRIVVAYIDLDGFKAINDAHGHEVGDQLLMRLAHRMKRALRICDTIARLGGDEFVAVLVDLDKVEDGTPLVERLLAAAAQPIRVGDAALQVSGSIGVTFFPQFDEEVDADQVLRQADQAMYQAKLSGKNRYHVFDAEHDRNVRGHHESLERIRQGLADGEFVLYYQPKVNLRSGEVTGAEALIRWRHPERGMLPPGLFLPAVENHPLGVELGEWVVDSALAQMEAWRVEGLDLPVSVNISAHHLQQPDFVRRLEERLAVRPDIDPGRLELEVLETSALEDMGHVAEIIEACTALGVGFALDDFGTGYSSLTYLKRLPARVLKIDKSFVRDMLDDPDDLAILEGVLGLATAFRRQTIAEGVETAAHGELLLQLGCDLAQGYGIARPMPPADLPGWIDRWEPEPVWSRTPRVSRDDLPLLYAAVEDRAWLQAIEDALAGHREPPPALDWRECRVGQWLAGATERRRVRGSSDFEAIDSLHRSLHELACAILAAHGRGETERARSRLPELRELRDRLLERLAGILQRGRLDSAPVDRDPAIP